VKGLNVRDFFYLNKREYGGKEKRDMQKKMAITQVSIMLLYLMGDGVRKLSHILLDRAVFILMGIKHHAMSN
jgi:hypothetical protein